MKIVLIEDDLDVANTVSQALRYVAKDLDIRVVTTDFMKLPRNGQWDDIDAILCDWSIPDFDTGEFLSFLAREKPHVRRVVYTAFPIETIPPDNIDQILQKPLAMGDIVRALHGLNQRGDEF